MAQKLAIPVRDDAEVALITTSPSPNALNACQLLRPCQVHQAHGLANIVRTAMPQAITTTPTASITAKNS